MGMFDTIHFPTPVKCAQCEAAIDSTQTKAFSNLMQNFQVGDTVESRFLSGVLEENFYCDSCKYFDQTVYVVIYHRILITVVEDLEVAHNRLKRMSAADLAPLYHALVARLVRWRVDYHRLYDAVAGYRAYLSSVKAGTSDANLAACLKADVPLLCLLSLVEEHPTSYQSHFFRWNPTLADLLKRQHELYERVEAWRRKYNNLSHLVKDYAEWSQLTPEEQTEKISHALFGFWHRDAKECADAEDPLECLLEKARTEKTSYFFL